MLSKPEIAVIRFGLFSCLPSMLINGIVIAHSPIRRRYCELGQPHQSRLCGKFDALGFSTYESREGMESHIKTVG